MIARLAVLPFALAAQPAVMVVHYVFFEVPRYLAECNTDWDTAPALATRPLKVAA